MLKNKKNEINKNGKNRVFGQVFKNDAFQRVLIGIISLLAVFIMISDGAAQKRYKLTLGTASGHDIQAPRDIENTIKTEEMALEKSKELEPIIKKMEQANTKILGSIYDFFDDLEYYRSKIMPMMEADAELKLNGILEQENQNKTGTFLSIIIGMTDDLKAYLFSQGATQEINTLKELLIREVLPQLSYTTITEENLSQVCSDVHMILQERITQPPLQQIAKNIISIFLTPNSMVDEEATKKYKSDFIESYKLEYPVMIYKGERIISKDDIVTADKIDVLRTIGYLDENNGPDYLFLGSVFILLLLLWGILVVFMKFFSTKTLNSRNELMLIASIIVLTVFLSWMAKSFFPEYAPYITIGFIAPVILAIFLDVHLAIIVNIVITLAVSILFKDNLTFVLMMVISGTIAAFLSTNASQRRRISLAGLAIGASNILVIFCMGVIEKKDWQTLLNEGGISFLNGVLSVILAIGLLPFLESIFNMITPLKLLELGDPNHPLLKKLLMEAPGTYHHSLMVGNLAEVGTRAIGGNALLARVGAYFHDIGKLKRPGFFKENQMAENPHDRITPNLSTLVITSHTKDGEELAMKYKLPKAIRDIIVQHHGSTLVAYFYHKAKQGEKGLDVKESNFRYEGPRPQSREAAVVLLADSVEAAVRSMPEKTKGKIEGLIRKIIKDKLDDGQLDYCELTLKNMNDIANGFLAVLSGFFHERTEYPELEKKNTLSELDNQVYNVMHGEEKKDEDSNTKQIKEKILPDDRAEDTAEEYSRNLIED
ncbi:MAG: HDIG domain-containing protein [Ruminiclostridium sp.]|nr:HDIG domain-containing protein [Ruminiclostridium sp.]